MRSTVVAFRPCREMSIAKYYNYEFAALATPSRGERRPGATHYRSRCGVSAKPIRSDERDVINYYTLKFYNSMMGLQLRCTHYLLIETNTDENKSWAILKWTPQ